MSDAANRIRAGIGLGPSDPLEANAVYADARAALDEVLAENERLQRERDHLKGSVERLKRLVQISGEGMEIGGAQLVETARDLKAAQARCARLEAALRQIAAERHTWSESHFEEAQDIAREALAAEGTPV